MMYIYFISAFYVYWISTYVHYHLDSVKVLFTSCYSISLCNGGMNWTVCILASYYKKVYRRNHDEAVYAELSNILLFNFFVLL